MTRASVVCFLGAVILLAGCSCKESDTSDDERSGRGAPSFELSLDEAAAQLRVSSHSGGAD